MSTTLTRELTRFLEVKPATGTRMKALHALIVGTVTLGALSFAFGIPTALIGVAGVFLSIAAYDRSLRSRARVLTRLALAYLIVVSIGAAASLLPQWQAVAVLAVLGTAVAFVYHAFLSDPPGPMLLILGAAAATYVPTLGVPIATVIGITALTMLIGCSTSLLLSVPHSRAAVEDQLEKLHAAVDAFDTDLSGLPTDEVGKLRDDAFGALFAAQASLRSSSPQHQRFWSRNREFSTEHLRIEDEIHALHLRMLRKMVAEDLPWACATESSLLDHYVGAPRGVYLLRWAFSLSSPAWLSARRTGVAILVAGETSVLLGSEHAFWSVMTAALVLSVPGDRISTMQRAAHRVVGTALGVLLFVGLHLLDPPLWAIAAIVVICIALTQILAPRLYLLAAMTMTPIPLLMAGMHAQTQVGELIESRIVETVIGAAAALILLWLPGRSSTVLLVRRQFRRAVTALDLVLRQMVINPSPDTSIELRRNLHFEQLAAGRTLAIVLNDQPDALQGWPEVKAALNELTYSVLTAVRTTDPAGALNWLEMARELEAFLSTLPPVSGLPVHASAAAIALTDVRLAGRPANA